MEIPVCSKVWKGFILKPDCMSRWNDSFYDHSVDTPSTVRGKNWFPPPLTRLHYFLWALAYLHISIFIIPSKLLMALSEQFIILSANLLISRTLRAEILFSGGLDIPRGARRHVYDIKIILENRLKTLWYLSDDDNVLILHQVMNRWVFRFASRFCRLKWCKCRAT